MKSEVQVSAACSGAQEPDVLWVMCSSASLSAESFCVLVNDYCRLLKKNMIVDEQKCFQHLL